jgi:hypothetical protein
MEIHNIELIEDSYDTLRIKSRVIGYFTNLQLAEAIVQDIILQHPKFNFAPKHLYQWEGSFKSQTKRIKINSFKIDKQCTALMLNQINGFLS